MADENETPKQGEPPEVVNSVYLQDASGLSLSCQFTLFILSWLSFTAWQWHTAFFASVAVCGIGLAIYFLLKTF